MRDMRVGVGTFIAELLEGTKVREYLTFAPTEPEFAAGICTHAEDKPGRTCRAFARAGHRSGGTWHDAGGRGTAGAPSS